ncbi:hypothetical protein [Azospirillum endophyticum]
MKFKKEIDHSVPISLESETNIRIILKFFIYFEGKLNCVIF